MRPDLFFPRGEAGFTPMDRLKSMEAPGRPKRQLAGTFLGDKVALKQAITLCHSCQHRFDYKRHRYYSVWRYENTPVQSDCNDCRLITECRFFLHEESVPRAWLVPAEARRIRRYAVCVGG